MTNTEKIQTETQYHNNQTCCYTHNLAIVSIYIIVSASIIKIAIYFIKSILTQEGVKKYTISTFLNQGNNSISSPTLCNLKVIQSRTPIFNDNNMYIVNTSSDDGFSYEGHQPTDHEILFTKKEYPTLADFYERAPAQERLKFFHKLRERVLYYAKQGKHIKNLFSFLK